MKYSCRARLVWTTSNLQEPSLTVSTSCGYHLADANCLTCNQDGLDVSESNSAVENFAPVLISVTICDSCGYRYTDVLSLLSDDLTSTRVKVRLVEDLKIDVVRCNTATVVVPELGASIRSGLKNEGFISDVEGVLTRVEDLLRFHSGSLEGGRRREEADLLLKAQRAREGRLRFTLALKDPFGNSTIISEKTKKHRIGEQELKVLKFGVQAIAAGNVQ